MRARETWKLVAHELPRRPKTVYDERLYEAGMSDLLALVNETADDLDDILLVGHNPGIQALADALTSDGDGDALDRLRSGGLPTAAIAVLTFAGSWKTIDHDGARLVSYWTPPRD